jgi:hypothetical protein
MTFVTLSAEQVKLIGDATSPIVLVTPEGREVGKVTPPVTILPKDATEEEVVAEVHRRMANDDGIYRPFSELIKELQQRFGG